MSALPSLDADEFAAFFRAVHGHEPFPWQRRLAQQVSEGPWPSVLALPTATGKTAALDVAVFGLALTGAGAARTAPLRVVYVVDRRTIVDQAYERAEKIRCALQTNASDVVQRVRQRLANCSHDGLPLRTALLRGGIARDNAWARTPDQPLIAISTVDQVGSRLLFRGYGVSDLMKPVHAGLLGSDVLFLLDEVHLSQPFRETLGAIRDRYRQWAERPLPAPFLVVEMSATPGDTPIDAFQLGDDDWHDPVLAARLRSPKPVLLVSTSGRNFLKEIEKHALKMSHRAGATVAVVVNRVNSAREAHEKLRANESIGASAVHLLTGRMRPFDRDTIDRELLQRIRADRKRSADDKPVVVVATQSIEAGADFDFDGLVTECASLDALRQRFGRLDRIGALAGSAEGVVVVRNDSLKDDPVYGDAIGKTWEWLSSKADRNGVDFGIAALSVPDDAIERGLLAPRPHAPVLLPSHLDFWSQTAPLPTPDPDVALWLHGPQRGAADVQIVWRADLSGELLDTAADRDNPKATAATDVALSMVEALPPVSAEAMSVPFLAARRWLEGLPEPPSFDVEGSADVDDAGEPHREGPPPRAGLVWQGDQSRVVRPRDIRPGQTIVVPSSYGGIAYGNWAPSAGEPVKDVAELAALHQGRRPTLRLHQSIVQGLFGAAVTPPYPEPDDSEAVSDRDIVRDWLRDRLSTTTDATVRLLLDRLLVAPTSLKVERLPLNPAAEDEQYFVVTGKRMPAGGDITAGDDQVTSDSNKSSFTGAEVTLHDHLDGVAELASDFGRRLGIPEDVVADLHLAGEWHDAGKADPRFQRWLHGGSEFKAMVQPTPLAKSRVRLASRVAIRIARERAGYPERGRHEIMSLALMQAAEPALDAGATDWALVQYLVASHHGHCRPLAPFVPDPHPAEVTFSHDGITCTQSSAHDFARLDSGVAERFWELVRRYGWWGLACLEAIFRLADHRQSEREQMPRSGRDA